MARRAIIYRGSKELPIPSSAPVIIVAAVAVLAAAAG